MRIISLLSILPLIAATSCKPRDFGGSTAAGWDDAAKGTPTETKSIGFLYGVYVVSQENCTDKKMTELAFPYSRHDVRDELVKAGQIDRQDILAGFPMGTTVTIAESSNKAIPQIVLNYKLRLNGSEKDITDTISIAPLVKDESVTIEANKVDFGYRSGGNFSYGTLEKKSDGSLLVSYKSGYRYYLPLPGAETFEGSCVLKPAS